MVLYEPQRGQELMTRLNHFVSTNQIIFGISSVLSDAIVFTFPIILIYLTLVGRKENKKELQEKALVVLTACILATITNLGIQSFVSKDRPETLEGLQLILNHLPTMSFPSDHSAVSMAFSISFLLLFSTYSKQYKMIGISILIGSVIMGICRTAVAVHRPTDILVGRAIGTLCGIIATKIHEKSLYKQIIRKIVSYEEWILDTFQQKLGM